jgi:hypothetical protein
MDKSEEFFAALGHVFYENWWCGQRTCNTQRFSRLTKDGEVGEWRVTCLTCGSWWLSSFTVQRYLERNGRI